MIKINLMHLNETQRDEFLQEWKRQDLYLEDMGNDCLYCAPWDWCSELVEVPENYSIEDLVLAYWEQIAVPMLDEALDPDYEPENRAIFLGIWAKKEIDKLESKMQKSSIRFVSKCSNCEQIDDIDEEMVQDNICEEDRQNILRCIYLTYVWNVPENFINYSTNRILQEIDLLDTSDGFSTYDFEQGLKEERE